MSPQRFLARLCALVPPPGAHSNVTEEEVFEVDSVPAMEG